jgi:nitroreductase
MDLKDAIYHRRAVRNYAPDGVPRSMIEDLLDAAVQAPSDMNQQPWAFAVYTGRDRLKVWSERAKSAFLSDLPPGAEAQGFREMLSGPSFNIFCNAPVLIVIWAAKDGMNSSGDCCMAAQNLMLSAHGMGLATCPIGLARPWLNLPEVKAEIGIPAQVSAVFPLIVGWPAAIPTPVERRKPLVYVWD